MMLHFLGLMLQSVSFFSFFFFFSLFPLFSVSTRQCYWRSTLTAWKLKKPCIKKGGAQIALPLFILMGFCFIFNHRIWVISVEWQRWCSCFPWGSSPFPPSSVNVNGANCNCPNFLIKLLGSFCFSFSISVARSCPSHFTSCHIGPYNQWSNC